MTVERKLETVGEALAVEAGARPDQAVKRAGLVWVVVVTKPFQEKRAKEQLEQQRAAFGAGFEVYLPLKLVTDRYRKGELTAGPFFPRYLFARVDLRLASWKRIWSTLGVHGILGASPERPYGVADWVIERLQAQEDAGFMRIGLESDQARGPSFKPGDVVRVAGSPLEGVFLTLDDRKRVAILVSLFGRDSRVTVDLAKLRSTLTD